MDMPVLDTMVDQADTQDQMVYGPIVQVEAKTLEEHDGTKKTRKTKKQAEERKKETGSPKNKSKAKAKAKGKARSKQGANDKRRRKKNEDDEDKDQSSADDDAVDDDDDEDGSPEEGNKGKAAKGKSKGKDNDALLRDQSKNRKFMAIFDSLPGDIQTYANKLRRGERTAFIERAIDRSQDGKLLPNTAAMYDMMIRREEIQQGGEKMTGCVWEDQGACMHLPKRSHSPHSTHKASFTQKALFSPLTSQTKKPRENICSNHSPTS